MTGSLINRLVGDNFVQLSSTSHINLVDCCGHCTGLHILAERAGNRLYPSSYESSCFLATQTMDTLFLTLNELPHDEDIDLNFYRTADGCYFSPRRHWCLVGQIVSIEKFLRLRLVVRDRDGVQFQL